MTSITDDDLDRYAASTASAAAAAGVLAASPNLTADEKLAIARVRDALIDQAAVIARSVRQTRNIDAVMFGGPDLIVAGLRERLTPGQCRLVARQLSEGTES